MTSLTTATSTTVRRGLSIRRGLVVAGITGAAIAALPTAAFADDAFNGKTLGFLNDSVCSRQAYAGYQVRAEGTATKSGAKFFLYKDGAPAYNTSPTSSGFAAEFRTAYGTFTGPGWYQVCAVNKQSTLTYATVRLRTDNDVR